MVILTPSADEHLAFLQSLLYELYDEHTRRRIDEWYRSHNLDVFLNIHFDGRLEFIVDFDDGYYKIYIARGNISLWPLTKTT